MQFYITSDDSIHPLNWNAIPIEDMTYESYPDDEIEDFLLYLEDEDIPF
jgi:hypothetical protein